METVSFKQFLQDLTKSALKENLLSHIIGIYYDKLNMNSKEAFFESAKPYYKSHKGFLNLPTFSDRPADPLKSLQNQRDFRIKSIRIANVRGIEGKNTGLPYGIDLTNDSDVNCNAIILGSNAAGKSSIFGAMEYIYTGKVSEAQLRTYDTEPSDDYYRSYLTRNNHSFDEAFCSVATNAGNFSLKKRIFSDESQVQIVNPHTHFISDYDIYEFGKLDYTTDHEGSFHSVVAKSLGLSEYLQFQVLIYELSTYNRLKEKTQVRRKEDEFKESVSQVEKLNLHLKEKHQLLQQLELNGKLEGESLESRMLKAILQRKAATVNARIPDPRDFIQKYNDYLKEYALLNSLLIKDSTQDEIQFLSLGLKLLDYTDGCPLCQSSTKDTLSIRNEVNHRVEGAKAYYDQSKRVSQAFSQIIDEISDLDRGVSAVKEFIQEDIAHLESIIPLQSFITTSKEILSQINNQSNRDASHLHILLTSRSPHDPESQAELVKFLDEYRQYYCVEQMGIIESFLSFLATRQQELIDAEEFAVNSNTGLSVQQQASMLTAEIHKIKEEIKKEISNQQRLTNEKKEWEQEVEMFQLIKAEAKLIYNAIDKQIAEIVAARLRPIKETVESILSDYYADENIKLKIEIVDTYSNEDKKPTVAVNIYQKGEGEAEIRTISPNKYFNTFHYRLFCTKQQEIAPLLSSGSLRLLTRWST
jgi:hypothetical protein